MEAYEAPSFKLDDSDLDYLASLLQSEIEERSRIGIGANGIGAIFTFMQKVIKAYGADAG